ncbi:MAG TPA: YbfB/YjiJ family MFS transporter, partial [Burkholderiales bacterium]|nr:YbfB/YjiJ family MFS transporter [Burkholderiales bacterium]
AGLQEARAIAGAQAPQLMAAMTAAFAAGQVAGPLVVSILVRQPHGFALGLAIAAAVLVLSTIALAAKEKKPWPT